MLGRVTCNILPPTRYCRTLLFTISTRARHLPYSAVFCHLAIGLLVASALVVLLKYLFTLSPIYTPSSSPQLNIFVIQYLFKLWFRAIYLNCNIILNSPYTAWESLNNISLKETILNNILIHYT